MRQYRSLEELREEARKVFEMIKEIPSMPEKEGRGLSCGVNRVVQPMEELH